tara:strand:+ start:283 stop:747 length:465 start_codon:yes stop_codon:yes gene_type:complete
MAVDLSNYDIKFFRGSNFDLDFSYTTSSGARIDLSGSSASMHIRRSTQSELLLGQLTDKYPVGSFGKGLTAAGFSAGFGVTGFTGGISLNHDSVTGDVKIEIDSKTSFGIPRGKHVYDLQIIDSDKEQKTILRGRCEVLETLVKIDRTSSEFTG